MQTARATQSQFLSTRCQLLLSKQRQNGVRSLPNTSTHDQQWELSPRTFDLQFNALSIRSHALSYIQEKLSTPEDECSVVHAKCACQYWKSKGAHGHRNLLLDSSFRRSWVPFPELVMCGSVAQTLYSTLSQSTQR